MQNIRLNKRQLAVLDDLFAGELSEQEVLDKHKLSRNLFNKWLADEVFAACYESRIAGVYRQSAALLARYAPVAAAKLIRLTESDKPETARRACLDIISMHAPKDSTEKPRDTTIQPARAPALSDEAAARLLAALAENESRGS